MPIRNAMYLLALQEIVVEAGYLCVMYFSMSCSEHGTELNIVVSDKSQFCGSA